MSSLACVSLFGHDCIPDFKCLEECRGEIKKITIQTKSHSWRRMLVLLCERQFFARLWGNVLRTGKDHSNDVQLGDTRTRGKVWNEKFWNVIRNSLRSLANDADDGVSFKSLKEDIKLQKVQSSKMHNQKELNGDNHVALAIHSNFGKSRKK